jgi:type IX secretion system PorP/SprF family membrane protein
MKKHLFMIGLCFSSLFMRAQDVHFSQWFNQPSSFQPAGTGFFDGHYRIAVNYRYQWPFGNPQGPFTFHTQGFNLDFAFLRKPLKNDWMGAALSFVNDRAGSGRLSSRYIALNLAYHKGFDKQKKYVLSLGVSGAYVNKAIDFNKLYFNNQWISGAGFEPGISNNEPIKTEQLHQLDLAAGMQISLRIREDKLLQLGASAQHLNRPENSFYESGYRLERKYMAHGTFTWEGKNRIGMQLLFWYQYQAGAMSWIPGMMFLLRPGGIAGPREHAIYLGALYRGSDALIPGFGYQYKGFRGMLTYDVTFSQLTNTCRSTGGLVLSLSYRGFIREKTIRGSTACPRF